MAVIIWQSSWRYGSRFFKFSTRFDVAPYMHVLSNQCLAHRILGMAMRRMMALGKYDGQSHRQDLLFAARGD
jgi:hypothetical protein